MVWPAAFRAECRTAAALALHAPEVQHGLGAAGAEGLCLGQQRAVFTDEIMRGQRPYPSWIRRARHPHRDRRSANVRIAGRRAGGGIPPCRRFLSLAERLASTVAPASAWRVLGGSGAQRSPLQISTPRQKSGISRQRNSRSVPKGTDAPHSVTLRVSAGAGRSDAAHRTLRSSADGSSAQWPSSAPWQTTAANYRVRRPRGPASRRRRRARAFRLRGNVRGPARRHPAAAAAETGPEQVAGEPKLRENGKRRAVLRGLLHGGDRFLRITGAVCHAQCGESVQTFRNRFS